MILLKVFRVNRNRYQQIWRWNFHLLLVESGIGRQEEIYFTFSWLESTFDIRFCLLIAWKHLMIKLSLYNQQQPNFINSNKQTNKKQLRWVNTGYSNDDVWGFNKTFLLYFSIWENLKDVLEFEKILNWTAGTFWNTE